MAATSFLACAAMKAAARLGPLAVEPVRGLGLELAQPRLLGDRQRRAGREGVERVARGRPAAGGSRRPAAAARRGSGAPSNTRRSGAPTMRSTIERSSNCPPAPTMNQPSPASQQRSCRVFRNRPMSLPSCDQRHRRARRRSRAVVCRCRRGTVRRWSSVASAARHPFSAGSTATKAANSCRAVAAQRGRRRACPWCRNPAAPRPARPCGR